MLRDRRQAQEVVRWVRRCPIRGRACFLLSIFWMFSAQIIDLRTHTVCATPATTPSQNTPQNTPQTPKSSSQSNHYPIFRAIKDAALRHPLARARRFEVQAERFGLEASKGLLDPRLGLRFNRSDDLVTISDPLQMNARRPIENQRYQLELNITQPLRWGTQVSLGFNQNLTETNNPFSNCVPGIVSEKCFESRLVLTVNQPLLRGRSSEVNLTPARLAYYGVRAAEASAQAQISVLVEETAKAYSSLVLAQSQVELEREESRFIKRQLQEANVRVQAGIIARSDLYPLQLSQAQRAQGLLEAEQRAKDAKKTLENFTKGSIKGVISFPQLAHFPSSMDTTNISIEHTQTPAEPHWEKLPQLISLRAARAQAEARLFALLDQRLPQLDLGLVWSQGGIGEDLSEAFEALPNNDSRFYGINLTLSYPISSRPDQLIAQSRAQTRVLEAEYEEQLQQLKMEWRRVQESDQQLKQSMTWTHRAIEAARKSWESAEARLQEGRGTQFEVLELQNRLLNVRFSQLQTRHQLFINHLKKLTLRGKLIDYFGIEVMKANHESTHGMENL